MSNKTTGQSLAQREPIPFNSDALIECIKSRITPDTAAAALDQAMYYLILYSIPQGIATEDHSDLYYYLREMRNAILIGSGNINLH